MRNALRAAWIVGMLGVLGFLLHEKSAAQQGLLPPVPPNLFTIHKLTDKLSIIAPYGPDMSQIGGNIGVFVTDEGVLVVDDNYYTQERSGQTVKLAEAVVAEIKKITQPAHSLHHQHAPSQRSRRRQSRVREARDDLRAEERPEQDPRGLQELEGERSTSIPMKAAPTVTYDGELIFHLGGEEIHLYHPARAHTDGDTMVHFKNANIALWGDAFINNWVPVIDVAGGASTLEWLQFLDRGHAARRRKRHDGARSWGDREGGRRAPDQDVLHEHARERAQGDCRGQDARAGDGRDHGAGLREPARRRGAHPHERRGGVRRAESGGKIETGNTNPESGYSASLYLRRCSPSESASAIDVGGSIVLIEADDEAQAYQRADEVGRSREHEYLVSEPVQHRLSWRFVRTERVQAIEQVIPMNGAELFSRFLRREEAESLCLIS